MTVHKRVEVTWESGTIEVFPHASQVFCLQTHLVVKQDDQTLVRGGSIKSIRIS